MFKWNQGYIEDKNVKKAQNHCSIMKAEDFLMCIWELSACINAFEIPFEGN